jgi:NADPH:quinone reductase-like Zn-dependent oxidoreductase
MKAIVRERYGRPQVLELRDIDQPELGDEQVLVRVRATSINASEWYDITGPYFSRPMNGFLGPKRKLVTGEVAGTVEAVGTSVAAFQPGDEVFGTSLGAWAEYAAARETRLARKPANVSFEEAAVVPIAGITALQALRDKAQVQPGQKVLINGASGGVGTFAVQLAKWLGADVTAVCSTRNVEQARSLGADRVIDYTQDDFTRSDVRHDVLIDVAGSRSFSAMRRVITPEGTIVLVGGKMTYRGLGPIPHLAATLLAGKIRRRPKLAFFVADINADDLALLAELMESGDVKPVIDRRYELDRMVEALTYFGEGHARGKVAVTV